jgi:predicted subunit of tRNA(5-methylaminomethyl-2-thiouridylate) methyltransferase
MVKENYIKKSRGLSLFSGGLDSQLAVKVLQRAGAHVEAITFVTPFFSPDTAIKAAKALGVELHLIDFTNDEIELIKNPPHGFGSAMNPCIDCHATMIKRAGEIMLEKGFDFIATGEVVNQRPMSQNKQAMRTVEKSSGFEGRLVRPLSALLLEPTIPETEGILDRSQLLDLSGRRRERQAELASEFGLVDYPSPGGGCKLTEEGFGLRLKDLLDHEGLKDRRLVDLLVIARRFRLPDGTGVILGRDARENATLKASADVGTLVYTVNCPGPTALVPGKPGEESLRQVAALVSAWAKYDKLQEPVRTNICTVTPPYDRAAFLPYQIL